MVFVEALHLFLPLTFDSSILQLQKECFVVNGFQQTASKFSMNLHCSAYDRVNYFLMSGNIHNPIING